ncbi:hypothetical protein HBI81_153870 [Parastagonospora nodorum]|nr:hypothetical protein HBI03_104830 [Parastagonospora nodorum]KAH4275192.1 hypothetical protein HBI04_130640 [Parastagonospora nodorum]KAH5015068.1 hypothetical protein HBI74_178350 [Parastagonospora nodorum]KAH5314740.1 hypothetical protein HBI50_140670 [Parastagonospora nodorum]KAH5770251.1 hypothetical protein HBI16_128450 [Parastagonospora nodorum]
MSGTLHPSPGHHRLQDSRCSPHPDIHSRPLLHRQRKTCTAALHPPAAAETPRALVPAKTVVPGRAFLAYNVYASTRTESDRRPSQSTVRKTVSTELEHVKTVAVGALRRMTAHHHSLTTTTTTAVSAQWELVLDRR